jgi:chorismate--pyruvate lyase
MIKSRHFREPTWRATHLPSSLAPPPQLWSWLRDQGSLTRRLQGRCPTGGFNVEVVSERLERPRLSEATLLGLAAGRLAWVRQVYLRCGTRRWVYARTVIPVPTLRGANAGLIRLGTRPLGGFLFSHPQVRRGELQVARTGLPQAGTVYGRRSLFFLRGRSLLVSEFFLDAFVQELTRE